MKASRNVQRRKKLSEVISSVENLHSYLYDREYFESDDPQISERYERIEDKYTALNEALDGLIDAINQLDS